MAVSSAQKVFIEATEEMNFVIEKILEAEKERVILVVPQGALITSSLISIKVLAKQMLESKKYLAIVTEDNFARAVAEQAGLVVLKKVSDITPAIWEKARLNKQRDKELLTKHKARLISNRTEDISAGVVTAAPEVVEIGLLEVADTPAEQEIIAEQPPIIEPEVRPYPAKKRLPAKMVTVGGLEICVGGDINDYAQTETPVVVESDQSELANEEVETAEEAEPAKVEYLGRDWTKMTKDPNDLTFWEKLKAAATGKRTLLILAIIVIIPVLFSTFLIFTASAEVTLKLKSSQVPVSEEVSTRPDAGSTDVNQLIIPSVEVVTKEVSRSATATADGTSRTGNKASGLIDFYNKTDQAVTITAGTKVVSIATNLNYLVLENFTIAAATGPASPTIVEKRIEAETFGDNYNIKGSSVNTQFKVGNYATDKVIAVRIRDFTGGDSKEIVVVSQANIDKAKTGLLTQVKEAAFAELNTNVPPGYILLNGSQQYVEQSVVASPALNQPASSFDLTLSGKATALAVAQSDLKQVAQILVQRSQSNGAEFDIGQVAIPEITAVTRQGANAKFRLASGAIVQTKIQPDELKSNLTGRTVEVAKKYLSGLTEVESFQVNYSASILPSFLQLLPSDPANIKITLK